MACRPTIALLGKVVLFRGREAPSRRALLISPDETPGPDRKPDDRRTSGPFVRREIARRPPERAGGAGPFTSMRIVVLIRRRSASRIAPSLARPRRGGAPAPRRSGPPRFAIPRGM